MKTVLLSIIGAAFIYSNASAQAKTTIGIVPFQKPAEQRTGYYNAYSSSDVSTDDAVTAIEDAVTDAFIKTKRFVIVDRAKMNEIHSEKEWQKGEDFIDGSVIEQSKSLGAEYIVAGDVSKASSKTTQTSAPYAGTITTVKSDIAFNIKVIDVSTGAIMASNSFSAKGRGKNAFENALDDIKPEIEQFIKDNFKVTLSVVSVDKKDENGQALKLLIAGGSSIGLQKETELKIYEATELTVDGKKMTRKVTVGKARITHVDDENFSVALITEGNDKITAKLADGKKSKCELIATAN